MSFAGDVYCALCGVVFSVYAELYGGRLRWEEVDWTSYYQLLRHKDQGTQNAESSSNRSWYLSGVGEIVGAMGWEFRTPIPSLDEDMRRQERTDINRAHDNVVAYKSRGPHTEVVYPFHPACWDIFLQNHAVLATRNPLNPDLDLLGEIFANQELEEDAGFRPDWSKDYAGAELFHSDGWAYHDELERSEVRLELEGSDEWDFIVCDPEKVTGLDEILNDPPLLPSGFQIRKTPLTSEEDDLFSQLPQEILQEILCLLPTSSVQAVRLASHVMAAIPLTFSYWRSRFEFPNELSHIKLPQALFPSQTNGQVIDWKSLCHRLLRPVGEQFKWWENRKRISTLTRKLAQKLLSESTQHASRGQEQEQGAEKKI